MSLFQIPDAHDSNDGVACIDLVNQPAQSPVSAFDEEIQPGNKNLNGNQNNDETSHDST